MKIKSLVLMAAMASAAFPALADDKPVQVRVINALPQSQGISVHMGGVQLFDGVKSNEITPYKAIPQQDDKKLTIQNGGQQLQTTREFNLDDDDENYTVLITPDESGQNPKVVLLDSDRDDVNQDEVELTVINAAPEHKSVKIKLNEDIVERGVNYGEASDEDVKPGVYNLSVINASGTDSVIATKSVTFTGGTEVTLLLTSPNTIKIVNDHAPQSEMGAGNARAMDRPATTGTVTSPVGGANTQAPSTMTTPAVSM